MSDDARDRTTEVPWTGRQRALFVLLLGGGFFVWLVWIGTSPIPTGKENRGKARGFLKELFPNRTVAPPESVTAPVATVFHLIRSGEPVVAKRAIEFAAEQRFGYASPYVIGRLDSGDPALQHAAQEFLRTIARADHGPDAESWKAWWRDPPRTLFGVVTVGQHTLEIAIPAIAFVAAVLLLKFGGRQRREAVVGVGVALLLCSWFSGFVLAMIRLVSSPDVCTFGTSRITYHADHGAVVGLEDLKVGGVGLLALLIAAFLLIPLVLAVGYVVFLARGTEPGSAPVDSAPR
jgi:hypothetical protein